MTTEEIKEYYQNLLIIQYSGKPKATKTVGSTVLPALLPSSSVQLLEFSALPLSGAFKLNYDGVDTASIAWNDSAATIHMRS